MRKEPTWYPAADANRCPGSFKTAIYYPDKDGKVECGVCGRKVGLRNPRTKQLAQHRRPKPAPVADVHKTVAMMLVGKPRVAEICALLQSITGVSVHDVVRASGDPQKEAALLREVSENAKPRDLSINDFLNLQAGGHRLK